MASEKFSIEDVIKRLEDANIDEDDPGISSDEEEDLDDQLLASDSDLRQVFLCF